jgi:hypothetical protein
MSGLISKTGLQRGTGSQTGILSNGTQGRGMTLLNSLCTGLFDENLHSASTGAMNTFNTNPETYNSIHPMAGIFGMAQQNFQVYHYLFGPDYASADAANGGWRIGWKFDQLVRIDMILTGGAKTNARAKYFGIYSRPEASTTATGQTFHQQAWGKTWKTGTTLGTTNRTIFGATAALTTLNNVDYEEQMIYYRNCIGKNFLFTFGDEVYNDGNNNAGTKCLWVYGEALT